jgi:hypothetical protein
MRRLWEMLLLDELELGLGDHPDSAGLGLDPRPWRAVVISNGGVGRRVLKNTPLTLGDFRRSWHSWFGKETPFLSRNLHISYFLLVTSLILSSLLSHFSLFLFLHPLLLIFVFLSSSRRPSSIALLQALLFTFLRLPRLPLGFFFFYSLDDRLFEPTPLGSRGALLLDRSGSPQCCCFSPQGSTSQRGAGLGHESAR